MAADEPDHSQIDKGIHTALDALNATGGMRRILYDAGHPAVFLDGDAIVKEYPDGTREQLGNVKNDTSDDGDDRVEPTT